MKIEFDFTKRMISCDNKSYPFDDPQGFKLASDAWLQAGWDAKYVYTFTWLGRPIIQLPDDMLRIQEILYAIKPTLIIETGVAHGGSLVFYASLLKLFGKGRVIGVDIEIRPHNRKAIESHELASLITLIEGSSIDSDTVAKVKAHIKPEDITFIILDANHTKDHVLGELRKYSELTSIGSYILACDGIMQEVVGAPRTNPDWEWNNPQQAVNEFLAENPNFILATPSCIFNESTITEGPTYWPKAWLKRVS